MSEHESNTIEALVARYELSRSESQTRSFTTGPDETRAIGELWQAEVDRVARAFRFTRWTLGHCLDVSVSMILQHDASGNVVRADGSKGPAVSDDRMTRLLFEDNAQTLASMIEMRDVFNYQVIHIARYPLRETTIDSLARLVEFDNEYRAEHPDTPEAYSK